MGRREFLQKLEVGRLEKALRVREAVAVVAPDEVVDVGLHDLVVRRGGAARVRDESAVASRCRDLGLWRVAAVLLIHIRCHCCRITTC